MTLRELIIKLGADTTDYDRKMVKSTKQLQDFGSQAESVGMRLSAAITLPIAAIGGAAVVAAGKMEQTSVAFTTLLKSSDAAKEHIAALKKFAIETPFQFEDVTKMSRLMQAMGTSVGDVVPRLRILGDAVSAMGGGNDVLERVVRSMSEIGTRGKITGEQLRELSRAGIPAVQAVAKALGVSVAEAQAKITAGAVDAKTATEALLKYMEEKFGGGMAAMAETLLGQWSNIRDKITFALADIGSALIPSGKSFLSFADSMLSGLGALTSGFKDMPKPIQEVLIGLAGLVAVAPLVVLGGGVMVSNISAIVGAVVKLGAVIPVALLGTLGPAALVMGAFGIAALIAGDQLSQATEKFQKANAAFETWLSKRIGDTKDFTKAHDLLDEALQKGAISGEKFNQMLLILEDREKKAFGEAFKGATAIHLVSEATDALTALNLKSTAARQNDLKVAQESYEVLKRSGEGHQVLAEAALKVQQAQEALNGTVEKVKEKFTQLTRVTLESAVNAELYNRGVARQSELIKDITDNRLGMFVRLWHSFVGDGPVIASVFDELAVSLDKTGKLVSKIMQDVGNSARQKLDPFGMLAEGAKFFGITTAVEFDQMAKDAQAAYDKMAISGRATYHDLEVAALKLQKVRADADLANERISKEAHDQIIRQADAELAKSGTVVAKIKKDRYDLASEVINASHRMFDGLERDLARNIVQWKGWKDTVKSLWQGLATDLLQVMFKTLLKPLEDAFAKVLGGLLGGGASAGGGVLGTSVGAAGGAAGTIAGGAGGGIAGGVGSAASGIAGSAFSAVTNMVTGAISAVTGVIGVFQNMHQETSLNAIEHNTRYGMMYLGERSDGGILGTLFKINEEIAWGANTKATEAMKDALIGWIGSGGKGGGGNTYTFDFRGATFGSGMTQASVSQMMEGAFEAALAAHGG